jgi:hypothetical protein
MVTRDLDAIVSDLLLVARHVAAMPRGYCGVEAARARVLLRRVDLDALRRTLYSVRWLTESPYCKPTRWIERQVYDAAVRLTALMPVIERQRKDIDRRLAA